ncbi:MAG: hypothetical protein IJX17_01770 [Clostridia bacterium]|nr:hypothetical protein [Clostridia bacterium]
MHQNDELDEKELFEEIFSIGENRYKGEDGSIYYMPIYFVKVKPTKKIRSIKVTSKFLREYGRDRSLVGTIQLCNVGGFATRPNPTENEFFTITFEDEEVKRYQRCYG